ncbi:MAG: glycoside hydrolase family 3 protein [Deltaproteobacteria bacterium]|nr:glycoside hydrolase family 3 protein [Deltaproteobacteria bacterium]
MKKIIFISLFVLQVLFLGYWKTPLLAEYRALWISLFLMSLLYSFILRPWRKTRLVASFILLLFFIYQDQEIRIQKMQVLSTNPQILEELGKHIIVGYRNFDEVKSLVEKGAIGGVFLTYRNTYGKGMEDFQFEIQTLQNIQKEKGRPPLIISTDQEGGMVSKLGKFVSPQTPLSQLLEDHPSSENLKWKVEDYARQQARNLKALGINVNLSPVVDLKPLELPRFQDLHTRISDRAISSDPNQVIEVAKVYLKTYEQEEMIATLKHFPGLQKIQTDTHLHAGVLEEPVEKLEENDFKPFRQLADETEAWMMLGHVQVKNLDAQEMVPFSQKIIQDLLRNQWNYRKILISDDFCMGPIFHRKGGLKQAGIDALNAGLDLILIAYDPDQYYSLMNGLIQASQKGELSTLRLKESRERLNTALLTIAKEKNDTTVLDQHSIHSYFSASLLGSASALFEVDF